MFVRTELRKNTREPLGISVQYSVLVSKFWELEKITDTAVSVDISKGGIGLLTSFMLEAGHVMFFNDDIDVDGINARIAVVKWVDRSDDNRYRVGLKFV
jgi:hypothetical protein